MKANMLTFSEDDIRLLYLRYKEYLVSVIVILISTILFLILVPAQIVNIFKSNDETIQTGSRVKILSGNFDSLSKVSEGTLDQQFKLSSSALPNTKDFDGIINGIARAALSSGVKVSDYGIEIGEVAPEFSQLKKISALDLSLTVDGGVEGMKRFLLELSKAFPLSEVTEVQTSGNSSKIGLNFYFKPFPPAKLDNNKPISPLSKTEAKLIEKLSSFGKASSSAF